MFASCSRFQSHVLRQLHHVKPYCGVFCKFLTQTLARFVEVATLVTVVLAFFSVGYLSKVHFQSLLQNLESIKKVFIQHNAQEAEAIGDDAALRGRQLRRRYLVTIGAVFCTFVLRAVFSTMSAVNASAVTSSGDNCGPCTAGCWPTSHYIYLRPDCIISLRSAEQPPTSMRNPRPILKQ